MPNLVVDIGNTNTKIAVFEGRQIVHYQRFSEMDLNILSKIIDRHEITDATVSSVGLEIGEVSGFLKHRLNYIPFTTAFTVGIVSHYETQATLGLDRWAKVVAAQGLFAGRNCLMIDAGTCITYDLLTAGNEYFGGSISLGIKMRFDALHYFTKRLPQVDWKGNEAQIPLGTTTSKAIKNGVLQGILHEIEGFIGAANAQNESLIVVLTGGDADFLNKQLKNSIFASQIIVEPHLVLKGLNEVITLSHVQ